MKRILVTGANGFVGKPLCAELGRTGCYVRGAVRSLDLSGAAPGFDPVVVGEVGPDTDWEAALEDIDVVIHLAGRVHVMKETSGNPLAEFRRVNTAGTSRLAKLAADKGVKRLLFISTVKVNGEVSVTPFTEQDSPHPVDDYAVSKWEAEQALREISEETGLEIVIIRPPLIYGPGVRGNFLRMLKWVDSGFVLPFRSIVNRRSLIALDNFVDLVRICVQHPSAANKTFLISDGADLSVPELIDEIAAAMGKAPRMRAVPVPLLKILTKALGFSKEFERLSESLQVDTSSVANCLEWTPPLSVNEGIVKTVQWYQKECAQ